MAGEEKSSSVGDTSTSCEELVAVLLGHRTCTLVGLYGNLLGRNSNLLTRNSLVLNMLPERILISFGRIIKFLSDVPSELP